MDRVMREKHAIVMAGFTAVATLLTAFGINRVFRPRTRKPLVVSTSVDGRMGLNCYEFEESRIVVSESVQDNQDETCSAISHPPSEELSSGIVDRDCEPSEQNLVELREKQKAKEKEELERLNACMKDLEGRIMKLSLQEGEITELKKRVKEDEEKLEKLNLQEVEIMELKKKIENDESQIQQLQEEVAMLRNKKKIENDESQIQQLQEEVAMLRNKKKIEIDQSQIQQLQEEVAMLRDKKNKKKHWWNKDASVHNAVAPVYGNNKMLR